MLYLSTLLLVSAYAHFLLHHFVQSVIDTIQTCFPRVILSLCAVLYHSIAALEYINRLTTFSMSLIGDFYSDQYSNSFRRSQVETIQDRSFDWPLKLANAIDHLVAINHVPTRPIDVLAFGHQIHHVTAHKFANAREKEPLLRQCQRYSHYIYMGTCIYITRAREQLAVSSL